MPIQIPTLGPGSTGSQPPNQDGATTPNLGFSRAVPPASDANFMALDAILSGQLGAVAAIPIIQNSIQTTNTNAPQSLSLVAPAGGPTFYEIPVYLNSRGDGAGGSTVTMTLTWTGVSGVVHMVTLVVSGTVVGQVQLETFPILVLGGSTVSVVTAFSTTAFHYDIAARVTAMSQ